ncbi:hypothetical protein [Microbacterium sp. NPDC055357]
MLDILTIDRFTLLPQVTAIAETTRRHGLSNVFNASTAQHGGSTYVAFRAEATPGERPFRAYVAEYGDDGERALIDLTDLAAEHGIAKTADPKLVILFGELYATYNTGNVHSGTNDILLQRLTPHVGPPQRCLYADRRMVEKNWGFVELPDGSLGALYSLAPTIILRHVAGEPGSSGPLTFAAGSRQAPAGRFPRLHIGSQPFARSATTVLVAANQQRPLPGLPRKIYFGRLAEVDVVSGRLARLSRRGLIHSWRAMLPQRTRHNPGLFSATYFSGLGIEGDQLTLAYGINDLSVGVARMPEDLAWK